MRKQVFTKRSRIDAPAGEAFRWHARPGALERLTPPWDPFRVVQRRGGIQKGATAKLKMKAGPIPYDWVAEHTDYQEGRLFRDRQVKGPFSFWEHTHIFEPDGDRACYMEDRIEYALPLYPLGGLAEPMVKKKLGPIFEYRHRTFASDIAAHMARAGKPLHVLISGASGLVGSTLVPFLTTGGHRVTQLVRRPPHPEKDEIRWDPFGSELDLTAMRGVDAVIHLSGENIGEGKWTHEKKKRIIDSRVKSTALIAKAISKLDPPPNLFLCASAIGYYGDCGTPAVDERNACGCDFISEVCDKWENAAVPAVEKGIRTVFLRIGIALSPLGGALSKLLPVFLAGLGGKIGTGTQYMSWIGIDDVIGAMYHLINSESVEGPVNATAPNPVTNLEFSKTLGRVLTRPSVFSVPEKAINLAFGEMGREVLLSGANVLPKRLLDSGYVFRNPDLVGTLKHLLGR